MAETFNRVTALGSTAVFSVPFPYLDRSHVKVYRNGVSAFHTFTSGSSIRLGSTPATGDIILIRRETPSTPLVDFTFGNLDPADLDRATLQSIYLAQEAADLAEDGVTRTLAGDAFTAQWSRITELAPGVEGSDAVTVDQLRSEIASIGGGGGGGGVAGVSSVNGRSGAVTLLKRDVNLDRVSNLTPAEMPVSDAQDAKFAPKANPTFTGTVTAPTPASTSNGTQVATTAFVKAIAGSATGELVDGSVTNAKLAVVPTKTLKGRSASGNGAATDLSPAQVYELLGLGDPNADFLSAYMDERDVPY